MLFTSSRILSSALHTTYYYHCYYHNRYLLNSSGDMIGTKMEFTFTYPHLQPTHESVSMNSRWMHAFPSSSPYLLCSGLHLKQHPCQNYQLGSYQQNTGQRISPHLPCIQDLKYAKAKKETFQLHANLSLHVQPYHCLFFFPYLLSKAATICR